MEVRFVFKKLTDRTRTHFFGADGDVAEETTEIGLHSGLLCPCRLLLVLG